MRVATAVGSGSRLGADLLRAAGKGDRNDAANTASVKVHALAIPYVLIGVIAGFNESYLQGVGTLTEIVEAGLAIFLWPLLLLGIDLHIQV